MMHQGVLRTPYGVLVATPTLVNEVFHNRQSHYTVEGYSDRMEKSFGKIFLGLDDGSEYQTESKAVNAAIMKVTFKDSFDIALSETATVLHDLGSRSTTGLGVDVEIRDLVDSSLSLICKHWFGLPDEIYIVSGGWHWRPSNEVTCPGHFHSPSRYIFQPNPGTEATAIGQRHGQDLHGRVLQYIAAVRGKGSAQGVLGREIFNAIPDPDDASRLASTLIGVMMGFLPTVDGNLRGALYDWINDRSFWDHQQSYLSSSGASLKRARSTLALPLQRAMQLRPVPEIVWRTVRVEHVLGDVRVIPGDKIAVSIVSATQDDLLHDRHEPYTLFGGQRSATNGHPTHACPGHMMAMGLMMGFLAALMERKSIAPTMSPMALRLT
jgi:cytochrome P450